jgi:hypothetical protein
MSSDRKDEVWLDLKESVTSRSEHTPDVRFVRWKLVSWQPENSCTFSIEVPSQEKK